MESPGASSSPTTLEPLATGQVSQILGRSKEGKTSETYRVNLMGSPRVAWLKLTDEPRHLVADVVAALVGRALGLPIPRPFLITFDRGLLPDSSRWYAPETEDLFFASQDAGNQVRSMARTADDSVVAKKLMNWSRYQETMAFDEWIANQDRNLGNLLFDPSTPKEPFKLIDHGDALGGAQAALYNWDDPALKVPNLLARLAPMSLGDDYLPKARAEANRLMADCKALALDALPKIDLPQSARADVDLERIRGFLQRRIDHTATLLMDKFGQMPLRSHHDHGNC